MAALEGAEAAVACASGMGATTALLFGLFAPGDHLVAARDLYGSTAAFLGRRGPAARRRDRRSWTRPTPRPSWRRCGRPRARSSSSRMSNPLLRLVDLPALAPELARRGHRPDRGLVHGLARGAAAHRARGDHGHAQPDQVHLRARRRHRRASCSAAREPMARVRAAMIRAGTNLGPFDAWLATRGARTLAVRMERQSATALALAQRLERHARGVARLLSGPRRRTRSTRSPSGSCPGPTGAMLSFDLRGGALGGGALHGAGPAAWSSRRASATWRPPGRIRPAPRTGACSDEDEGRDGHRRRAGAGLGGSRGCGRPDRPTSRRRSR